MRGDEVAPRLFVGPAPFPSDDLSAVDVLVLAAAEHQPRNLRNLRGCLLSCGIEDDYRSMSDRDKQKVAQAARVVAKALWDGKLCLCTCQLGRNRSALVAACALKLCTSKPLDDIVADIRAARGDDALENPEFVRYLYEEAPIT